MTVRPYVSFAIAALMCGTGVPLLAQQPSGGPPQAAPAGSSAAPILPARATPLSGTNLARLLQSGGNQQGAFGGPGTIALDFDEADLRIVIAAIAKAGGIDYTDNDIPGKRVSLHVRLKPGRANALALLKQVVVANGLYMVNRGGVTIVSSVPPLSEDAANNFAVADTELFVYRLKHANATSLAQVLQAIFNGGSVPTGNTGINRPTLSRALSSGGIGGNGGGFGGGGIGGGGNFGNGGGNNLQNLFQNRANNQRVGGVGGRGRGPITIVPEVSTNSLLIRADSADWRVVKQAIESVDIRPLQVLIEVMIVEVQRNENLNLGIGVNGSNQRTFKGRSLGSANLPTDTSSSNFIANFTRYGAVDINVALSALQSRGDVHILSRPIVFAENNVESSLLVGSQQPFVQSTTTQPTASTLQNQVVQYRNVGTSLDILPTINPDGYVNLLVQQEISAATSKFQFGAPVITTREATASLFVKDGQTVVVGGLTDNQQQKTRTGIPFLSSLPLIGGLFGSTQNVSARTELYLFLTPHIVRSDEDVKRIENAVRKNAATLMKDLPASQYVVPQDTAADSVTAPVQTIQLPKKK